MRKLLAITLLLTAAACSNVDRWSDARKEADAIELSGVVDRQPAARWKENDPTIKATEIETAAVRIDANAHPTVAIVVGPKDQRRYFYMEADAATALAGQLIGRVRQVDKLSP